MQRKWYTCRKEEEGKVSGRETREEETVAMREVAEGRKVARKELL